MTAAAAFTPPMPWTAPINYFIARIEDVEEVCTRKGGTLSRNFQAR
jgi:hypothetical protein